MKSFLHFFLQIPVLLHMPSILEQFQLNCPIIWKSGFQAGGTILLAFFSKPFSWKLRGTELKLLFIVPFPKTWKKYLDIISRKFLGLKNINILIWYLFGFFYSDCKSVDPSKTAMDELLQRTFWKSSEKIVNSHGKLQDLIYSFQKQELDHSNSFPLKNW